MRGALSVIRLMRQLHTRLLCDLRGGGLLRELLYEVHRRVLDLIAVEDAVHGRLVGVCRDRRLGWRVAR